MQILPRDQMPLCRLADVRVTHGARWRACVAVPAIFDFVPRGGSEILKEIFLKFIFLERNSGILQRFCSNRLVNFVFIERLTCFFNRLFHLNYVFLLDFVLKCFKMMLKNPFTDS